MTRAAFLTILAVIAGVALVALFIHDRWYSTDNIIRNHPILGHVRYIGSAKLGFPDRAIVAICLGADLINIARESMMAIGCIQAQQCHTGRCPTGVTTHDPKLQRGLVPEVQADRFAHYVSSFRNELMALTHACGYRHPSEFTADDVEVSTGAAQFKSLRELEGCTPKRRSHATL